MFDVITPARIEEGFCDVRYPVRFREQLLSDVNDSREVEVVPVNESVIDPVKRRVKPGSRYSPPTHEGAR